MAHAGTSILVVDDARFSSTIISRTLKAAGFDDIRTAASATDALRTLDERPAGIVVADWLMPEIDGLELTRRIRQLDEASNRYTYVILITAKEGDAALVTAFDEGVDDFVNKATLQQQLLPRVLAAERIVAMSNRLLADNQLLLEQNRKLRTLSTLDPLTGLGNRGYAQQRVADALRQAHARGGAACYLLIQVANYAELEHQLPKPVFPQLITGIARRLRQLVRPLDMLTRVHPQQFALITHQPDIRHCTSASFRRLLDGLNQKEFRTSAGYATVTCAMALVAADVGTGLPEPEALMNRAESLLPRAQEHRGIIAEHWSAPVITAR